MLLNGLYVNQEPGAEVPRIFPILDTLFFESFSGVFLAQLPYREVKFFERGIRMDIAEKSMGMDPMQMVGLVLWWGYDRCSVLFVGSLTGLCGGPECALKAHSPFPKLKEKPG